MSRPAKVALLSAVLAASLQGALSQETVSALEVGYQDPSLKGFSSGFVHGNYGYMVPNIYGSVARISLMGTAPSFAGSLNVHAGGFSGGFTDGTFGYLVPETNGTTQVGVLVRFRLDTFTFDASLDTLYLDAVNPQLKGFHGGFSDPKLGFGYLVPYMTSPTMNSGYLARFSSTSFSSASVSSLNLATINSKFVGFTGGFEDGAYGYLLPDKNSLVVRFSLSAWQTVSSLDISVVGTTGCHGGFRAGGYGYVVSGAVASGAIARFSLASFAAVDIQVLNFANVDSTLNSFSGGFHDGRYGYAIKPAAGIVARFNLLTLGEATRINLAATNTNLKGFKGGFSDGIRAYFVPFQIGSTPSGLLAHIAVPPMTTTMATTLTPTTFAIATTTTTTLTPTMFATTSAVTATTPVTWTTSAIGTGQGAQANPEGGAANQNCVRLSANQVHQVVELAKHGWKVAWARGC